MHDIAIETSQNFEMNRKENMDGFIIVFFLKTKFCILIDIKIPYKQTLKFDKIYIEKIKFHSIKKSLT